MFHSLRPGVYARYELSGTGLPGGSRAAALVLRREDQPPGCHKLLRFSDASGLVSGDPVAEHCLRLLFESGAAAVHLVFYKNGEEALCGLSTGVSVAICDESLPREALLAYLEACAAAQCDCLILTGSDAPEEADAHALSHERILLCGPSVTLPDGSESALFAACALAGEILLADDPMERFSGMEFPALCGAAPLPEEQIQRLLGAGVCVFEEAGGRVRLIRASTTAEDPSLRSLGTVLITDYVMARIRRCLQGRLQAGVTSPASIGDQVAVELIGLVEEGVLTGYDPPVCRAKEDDPTCCVVSLSFAVAHLLSRIHITARVRA